jgi:O-antigen ligase
VPSILTITAPTWSGTAQRAAEPLRVGAFALAIAAVELVLAKGIVGPEISRYVFLFLGLFAVAFVFRFPMATALIFFGLTDFVFAPAYFAHNVGSLSVRPHEVALFCLLVLAAVRPRRQTWGGNAGAALAIFLALVAFSAMLAVKSGDTSFSDAFNWARPLSLLTFFYVVVRLFPSVHDRRLLLNGAAILAAVTGLAAIAVSSGVGPSFIDSARQAVTGQAGAESIDRVRLAGLSAGYALFWYAVVQVVLRRGNARLAWGLVLAGITVSIGLSFNRNMWLGLALGAILMAILGGGLVRTRMAIGGAVLVTGLALLLAAGSESTETSVVQPIVKRGETILNPGKTEQEDSLQSRSRETEEAWKTARENLVLGIGAGVPFGIELQQPVLSGSFIVAVDVVPQLFLHNQYLYLVLIAGVPGLIAFLCFLGMPLLQALRRWPRDPAIAACGVGIALIMISSTVAIYFTVEDMTAVLGLLTGVIVADAQGRAAARRSSGLAPPGPQLYEASAPVVASGSTAATAASGEPPLHAASNSASYRETITEASN